MSLLCYFQILLQTHQRHENQKFQKIVVSEIQNGVSLLRVQHHQIPVYMVDPESLDHPAVVKQLIWLQTGACLILACLQRYGLAPEIAERLLSQVAQTHCWPGMLVVSYWLSQHEILMLKTKNYTMLNEKYAYMHKQRRKKKYPKHIGLATKLQSFCTTVEINSKWPLI